MGVCNVCSQILSLKNIRTFRRRTKKQRVANRLEIRFIVDIPVTTERHQIESKNVSEYCPVIDENQLDFNKKKLLR